jgi:hypothetical protein
MKGEGVEAMQREIWTREDLQNALVAAYYAGTAAQGDTLDTEASAYLRGFHAALMTLALSFGLPALPTPPPNCSIRAVAEDREAPMLWSARLIE